MNRILLIIAILIMQQPASAQDALKLDKTPLTKKGAQSDTYHGHMILDPYRWLEDDNAVETKTWVDMQNTYTENILKQIPFRSQIKRDLTSFWNYEKYSAPFKKGDYYFFYKNDGLQNQAVLYYQKGLSGDPTIFIDPNTLNENGTAALGSLSFSKDYSYCTYAVSQAGSDWQDIYVMEVASRKKLNDSINYTKFSNAAWIGNKGFYYSGYDHPKNEAEKFSAKTEYQKIFYHAIGTLQSEDRLIYEDTKHALRYKGVSITDDERFLILYQSEGTDGAQIDFVDLTKDRNPTTTTFKTLLPGFNYNYDVIESIKGELIVYTNHGADNYQLVSINPNKPDPKNWKTIIPMRNEKLDQVSIVGDQLFCTYLKNATTYVERFKLDGESLGTIALPGLGTADGFRGSLKDDHTFFTYTSFNTPPTIYKYDLNKGTAELFKKSKLSIQTDNIMVDQMFFPSKDGTMIPMFVVHRDDLDVISGATYPTLLYGYGGFNISLTPSFSISNAYFVQQGGIYVMVNLRGGSEYGEQWHKAGMMENKQNVFDDFIGAAEYLIKNGITSSDKLAISGRSNGGLLVGACMTQRPDLYKVALPGVGVLDMLRYHKFTVGWGWVVEYGSSDHKKDFEYLIKYSPLHNVKKGVDYPNTLITTADHDDRVVPAHSFKFAATLQEMNSGRNPIAIRVDKQAGHGAGKPTTKIIEEYTDILSFTMYYLGMKPE